jgi:hypothetical protein
MSWPASEPAIHLSGGTMDGRLKGGHDKVSARWVPLHELPNVALPTVMRKIVEHGLDSDGPLFELRKPRA